MRNGSVLVVATCVCLMLSFSVSGGEVLTPATVTDVNSVTRDLEFIHTLVARVKERGTITVPENAGLEERIGRLIESKVLGLTAAQRQELVKKTIGEEDYRSLETTFTKLLGSSDITQHRSAIRSLGNPLFALGEADAIKASIFQLDRTTQFLALRSLVYLGVAGADYLLGDVILSGALPFDDPLKDYQLSTGIKALYLANSRNIEEVATGLLQKKLGGATFQALLPVLKKRSNYREIIAQVFKSQVFEVPDAQELNAEARSKESAEHEILYEIFDDPKSFMGDEGVKATVVKYASNKYQLYTVPLLILEKSGQDLEFFTKMQNPGQLTPEKKKVLDLIISRIQNGQRLK